MAEIVSPCMFLLSLLSHNMQGNRWCVVLSSFDGLFVAQFLMLRRLRLRPNLLFLSVFATCVCFPAYGLTGLARGGQQLTKCKEMFGKVVKLLVELASLQVSQ